MLIVSPSYKRADDVKIRNWFFDITLAVHEFEAEEYKEKQGGNLMILPDFTRGNMAKVRQYILDQAGKDEWVVMILRINRNYYKAAHLTVKGGCGVYRNLAEEKKQAEIFTKKWGSKVIKWAPERSTNPRLYPPIPGV